MLFRSDDLFLRLNVFPILLPSLKERPEDIPLLAQHFLEQYRQKNQRQVKNLAPEVLEAFGRYPWPGNIRELENVIERGVIICQGDTLTLKDLPAGLQRYGSWFPLDEDSEPNLAELERQLINQTLKKVAGQRQQAAEILGISLEELNLKIRSYRLEE